MVAVGRDVVVASPDVDGDWVFRRDPSVCSRLLR
jgi:hypothetical protein